MYLLLRKELLWKRILFIDMSLSLMKMCRLFYTTLYQPEQFRNRRGQCVDYIMSSQVKLS